MRYEDGGPKACPTALILVIDSMVKRAKLHRMTSASPKKRATSSARGNR